MDGVHSPVSRYDDDDDDDEEEEEDDDDEDADFFLAFFPRDPFRDKTGAAGPGRSIAVHPTRRLSLRSVRQRQPIALLMYDCRPVRTTLYSFT